MAEMKTLKDLYIEQLRDLYSAESQLVDALPRMVKKASNDQLRNALEEHLEVTKSQKDRLEKLFEKLEKKPTGHTCKGMKGLIEEGKEILEKKGDENVIDAGIIAAAQRVEHYEIAGYGTARTYATRLGENDAAHVLDEILDEEAEADEKLTEIAESTVNRYAEMAGAR